MLFSSIFNGGACSHPCRRSLSSLLMWLSRLRDSIIRSLKFSIVLDISPLEYYK